MYPDIVLITEAAVGVPTTIFVSVARFAPDSLILIKPNEGLDRENGERGVDDRLWLVERSLTDWVLVMDDDDELISPMPSCQKLDKTGGDAVFYNFLKNDKVVDFMTCHPYKAHGFCGIIAKRSLVLSALEYTKKMRFLREDVGFLFRILMLAEEPKRVKQPLIRKIDDREPKRNAWLRNGMAREVDRVWRTELKQAQNKLKGKELRETT